MFVIRNQPNGTGYELVPKQPGQAIYRKPRPDTEQKEQDHGQTAAQTTEPTKTQQKR